MRRGLIVIAIFLLAGGAVNVVVAWGCALWSDLPLGKQYMAPTPTELAWWRAHAPPVIDSDPIVVGLKASPGLTVRQLSGLRHNPAVDIEPAITNSGEWFRASIIASDLSWDHVARTFAGWPFRSLSGDRWQGQDFAMDVPDPDDRRYALLFDSLPRPGDEYRAAIPVSRGRPSGNRTGLLPLRPEWPGVVANAVVYGAALGILAATLMVLRRFVRVRRRLCPACRYPMGESALCTECGNPLPKRAGANQSLQLPSRSSSGGA
jgi:hypothetical protein